MPIFSTINIYTFAYIHLTILILQNIDINPDDNISEHIEKIYKPYTARSSCKY